MSTIDILERTLHRLLANAAARRVPLDAYLAAVADADAATAGQLAAIESFVAGMGAAVGRTLPAGHVVDDSRESIYADREPASEVGPKQITFGMFAPADGNFTSDEELERVKRSWNVDPDKWDR